MKVYIYGIGDDAKAIAEQVKDGGDSAFIRDPEFFNPNNSPDLKCDVAVTDCDKVAGAFTAAGVSVKSFADYAKPKEQVIFKSAETGEFVSEETAEASPATTYKTRKRK